MITNGPKMRLKSAPGRRTVSRTSLPMKDVVLVQDLSSPSNTSPIADTAVLLFGRVVDVGVCYELGEHLVERRPIFAAGEHFDAGPLDRLQHARSRLAGIVSDDQEMAWRTLPHRAHAWHLLEHRGVERLSRLDFEDLAAQRHAPQVFGGRQRDQSTVRQNGHGVAVFGLADVLS